MSVAVEAQSAGPPPAGPTSAGLQPGAEEFARLTGPFRAELLAYCYRMLGSVHDAEDQVQETLIRAWRSYGEFAGRASLRTWLYRIATNVCLRAVENRSRRPLPSGLGGPGEEPGALGASRPQVPWLEPFPDGLLGAGYGAGAGMTAWAGSAAGTADPASAAVAREDTRLALIAALQYLPARQRAVLILRDVLAWRAAEVAELIGVSTAAVNSTLQRARARLQQVAPARDEIREPVDASERALLGRYAAAFENADVTALMELLREDASFEMPPLPTWFTGRERIGAFLKSTVLREPGAFAMIPTMANGQRAFAVYQRDPEGVYLAHAIQVLTITGSRTGSLIGGIVSFLDPDLFAAFSLPPTLLP